MVIDSIRNKMVFQGLVYHEYFRSRSKMSTLNLLRSAEAPALHMNCTSGHCSSKKLK